MSWKNVETKERDLPVYPSSVHANANISRHISGGQRFITPRQGVDPEAIKVVNHTMTCEEMGEKNGDVRSQRVASEVRNASEEDGQRQD